MIVFALALHVCTTVTSLTWSITGPVEDTVTSICAWQPRGALYVSSAVCEAAGKHELAAGPWGDDIANVRHVPDRYSCSAVEVHAAP